MLPEPGVSPRENFLSETPPGAMQHSGYSELLQETNEAPVQCWLKSEIPPKGICITPSDSTPQHPRPAIQGMPLTKTCSPFPFAPSSETMKLANTRQALDALLFYIIHMTDLHFW